MATRIFLDYAATSPLRTVARQTAARWLDCGNASSIYEEGRLAKAAIDAARATLADALSCQFGEVIFTSSATESVAMAILGTAVAGLGSSRNRVILGSADHHCALETSKVLSKLGYSLELLPSQKDASYCPETLQKSLASDVLLVGLIHANNEIGTINDVTALLSAAKAVGATTFCDSVQAFGKLPVSPDSLLADMVAVSSHKMGGPKGAAALAIRAGIKPAPIFNGGGQERDMRAGTENVAAIAGFASAVAEMQPTEWDPVKELRDVLRKNLVRIGFEPTVDSATPVLPGHLHGRFTGVHAETLLIRLDRSGISASSGAACSSGSLDPSHVMIASGRTVAQAREGVRFSLGPGLSLADIEEASNRIEDCLRACRGTFSS